MDTVTDRLAAMADDLLADTRLLLLEHSTIRDINDGGGGLVWIGSHYAFGEVGDEGRVLQSKILKAVPLFISLVRTLLAPQSEGARKQVDDAEKTLRAVVEQTRLVWHSSTHNALQAVENEFAELIKALRALYDPVEGLVALVPDTNALLYNSSLKDWSFPDLPSFSIVLVPGVLSELDELKVNHRNPDVREKAESLIRQIKEYRRRGNLTDGVPIVRDRITLRSVAVEPRTSETLPWLDADSADDRILAAMVDVMRLHPRAAVALVSRDINLQNKADYARVPYFEPPDPSEGHA